MEGNGRNAGSVIIILSWNTNEFFHSLLLLLLSIPQEKNNNDDNKKKKIGKKVPIVTSVFTLQRIPFLNSKLFLKRIRNF